jgi:hypothetical protein
VQHPQSQDDETEERRSANDARGVRQGGLVHALFERLTAHRSSRRILACLECGLQRMVGPDAGECPACGYLGWREAGEHAPGIRTHPLIARDTP